MSGKLIAALLLIGLLILIVIVNASGVVSINLLFAELRVAKTILIFGTFVVGLVTGVLLKQ